MRRADVFSELVRLETELWNAVDGRLRRDADVTLGRVEVMGVIGRRAACRVNDIADDLVITIGGASKLVDRIEERGHCQRSPNPRDARSSIIGLTRSGRRLLAKASAVVDDELAIQFAGALSEPEWHQFATTLDRLRVTTTARRRAS
jgi:DNA-binding MarR family transcriptional regulator